MVFSRTMLVIHGIALLCQTAMSTQRLAFTRDEDELVISAAINSSHAELSYTIVIDIAHGHTLVIDTVLTAEATDLSPHPVVFIVKQEEVIDHWHLPSRNGVKSNFSSRTLCPPADGRQSMDILLTVSTMSKMWIPFTVVLRRARYLISPEQPSIPITVSPTSPWVFRLELSENLRYLVKLRNMSTSVCSVVTVRPDNNACPLPHMENEMVFGQRAKHQVSLKKQPFMSLVTFSQPEQMPLTFLSLPRWMILAVILTRWRWPMARNERLTCSYQLRLSQMMF